jgi:hypothetical protein
MTSTALAAIAKKVADSNIIESEMFLLEPSLQLKKLTTCAS